MRITSMLSPQTGNPVANQFIINNRGSETFQSYNTIIAKETNKTLYIDSMALEYSQTTLKYLKEFLRTSLSKKKLTEALKTGKYFNNRKVIVKNLNK